MYTHGELLRYCLITEYMHESHAKPKCSMYMQNEGWGERQCVDCQAVHDFDDELVDFRTVCLQKPCQNSQHGVVAIDITVCLWL